MSAWAVTIIDGVITGLGLYALVRVRMHLGPIARDRFGEWGRRGVWILLILSMVALAETGLIWLRFWIEQYTEIGTSWRHEASFALIILIVGLALVCIHVARRRTIQTDKAGDTGNDNHRSC